MVWAKKELKNKWKEPATEDKEEFAEYRKN